MQNFDHVGNLAYRADIDGLRAIAVLSVLIYHAFPDGVLRGGFVGVDIFFVISGYLITLVLLGDLDRNRYSSLAFYSRRILRIFPALIIVLFFCMLAGWFSLFADEYRQLGKHVAGGAGFVANLVLWDEVGYFDNASKLKPLLHLWSLGIEEQFYILWPLLLLLIYKTNLSFVPATFIIASISFIASIYLSYTSPTEAFFSPLTRCWELMAGGALAYMTMRNHKIHRRYENLQAVTGLVLLAVGLLAIKTSPKWALLPVAGAFLLISAGPDAWINRKVLANKIMVGIGLISYPLYLWHWPLLSLLRIGAADGTPRDAPVVSRLLAILLAFLLSWVTYKYIERPIRFGEKKRTWTFVLGLAMLAIGVFGYAVFSSNGVPSRMKLDPPSAAVLFSDYPHPLRNEACRRQYPELDFAWSCLLSKPNAAKIALIGDSHAHQYYQSLANRLSEIPVLSFSLPVCLPFSSTPRCDAYLEKSIKFIEENDSVETIILTGYFSFLAAGFRHGNVEGFRVANDLNHHERHAFQASATKMLSALTAMQKKVVVMIDIPDMIFRPRDCVTFHNPVAAYVRGSANRRSLDSCGVPVDEFRKRMQAHDSALLEVLAKYPEIKIFDPRPLFCDEKICAAFKSGRFLYWNSDHLTLEGADLVIGHLLDSMELDAF